jgi:glycerol-3-phosphate dehydrogenase (NAD(P)+)
MTRVAVMGSGSWGTAFGVVLADAGAEVALWGLDQQLAEEITRTHENTRYHPGIELPWTMWATTDAERALAGADIVVFAVPSQTCRENLAHWGSLLPKDSLLVSLMKGIELGTTQRMSEVIMEAADVPQDRVAAVSGPNLAREIMMRQPAATVVACTDESHAKMLQRATMTAYFRPYTNTDIVGVELAGALKNVIALANGIAVGMGFGDNTQASLITRGLAEEARLGAALGADPATFAGLAGLGDLVATCTSPLSRNRTFGENLGKGMTVDEVVAVTKQTAEGVKSCRSIHELAKKHDVYVPITDNVVKVVHEGMSPRDMLMSFMTREGKAETD